MGSGLLSFQVHVHLCGSMGLPSDLRARVHEPIPYPSSETARAKHVILDQHQWYNEGRIVRTFCSPLGSHHRISDFYAPEDAS